jgi:pilus assembly protein Flp/PilA
LGSYGLEGEGRVFLRVFVGVTTWWADLKHRLTEDGGATAVEYALMLALIATIIVVAVAFLGKSVSNQFNSVGSGVDNPS